MAPMTVRKYEHLLRPLSIGQTSWEAGAPMVGPGNATREIRLNGRDHLEGLNLNFSFGVHRSVGEWHRGMDPHVHPYPECLVFAGLDTANVNYLGAEIHCCLGEEQETYTFNEPTAIVVPAGLPHGPIETARMYSPKGFGFWAVELNRVPEVTWLGKGEGLQEKKPAESTGKYAHLVKPLRAGLIVERGKIHPDRYAAQFGVEAAEKLGPGYADHLTWMCGGDLDGMDVNIRWGFCSRPGIWRREAESPERPLDEVLVYLGTDPNDLDYLGAEIELEIGEEPERYVIDKPTAVIYPAGVPRAPQLTRWVDKPFAFFAIGLSAQPNSFE
jgi:hypothetical protein